jgi:hypothetical protein
VKFGNDIKTVYVVAVPIREGHTLVHYKLYRNFFYIHPRDQVPRMAWCCIQELMHS